MELRQVSEVLELGVVPPDDIHGYLRDIQTGQGRVASGDHVDEVIIIACGKADVMEVGAANPQHSQHLKV